MSTVAVNPALDAPEPTVILPGTVTDPLLLARLTATLLVACEVRLTLQESVPLPLYAFFVQEMLLTDGAGDPLDFGERVMLKVFPTPPALAVRVAV